MDFKNSFNPAPKPVYKKKKSKVKQWDDARAKIKPYFEKAGITSCEGNFLGCTFRSILTFAHLKKRRNLTFEELFEVVLLCQNCHDFVEALGEKKMQILLEKIISQRPKPVLIPATAYTINKV